MTRLVNNYLQELIKWIDTHLKMNSDDEQFQRNKVVTDKSNHLQNIVNYENKSSTNELSRSEFLLEWRELIQLLKRADIQS